MRPKIRQQSIEPEEYAEFLQLKDKLSMYDDMVDYLDHERPTNLDTSKNDNYCQQLSQSSFENNEFKIEHSKAASLCFSPDIKSAK